MGIREHRGRSKNLAYLLAVECTEGTSMRQLFFAVDPVQLYNWHFLSHSTIFKRGRTGQMRIAPSKDVRKLSSRQVFWHIIRKPAYEAPSESSHTVRTSCALPPQTSCTFHKISRPPAPILSLLSLPLLPLSFSLFGVFPPIRFSLSRLFSLSLSRWRYPIENPRS